MLLVLTNTKPSERAVNKRKENWTMKKFETPTVEVLEIVTENILTGRGMELGGGGSVDFPDRD